MYINVNEKFKTQNIGFSWKMQMTKIYRRGDRKPELANKHSRN